MERGVIAGYAPMAYTHEQNGVQYKEYRLNKRDTLVVVAQLSPEFTARLVDRWQELEAPPFSSSGGKAKRSPQIWGGVGMIQIWFI